MNVLIHSESSGEGGGAAEQVAAALQGLRTTSRFCKGSELRSVRLGLAREGFWQEEDRAAP